MGFNRITDIDKFIKNKSADISSIFKDVAIKDFVFTKEYEIECNKLKSDYLEINITDSLDFRELFDELKKYEDYPAIYIFKINPEIERDVILKTIKDFDSSTELNFPALNNFKENHGVLYVGKVKKSAWGRLIQHLGYHQNRKSHGLQLDSWAKESKLQLDIKFQVVFFEKCMSDYLEILEKELAATYQPILGKH